MAIAASKDHRTHSFPTDCRPHLAAAGGAVRSSAPIEKWIVRSGHDSATMMVDCNLLDPRGHHSYAEEGK
jgi:hypothetical protein